MTNRRRTHDNPHERILPRPTYSIVLPAFNESVSIGDTLERIFAHTAQREWQTEVIVVNDGSSDGTGQIVTQCTSKYPMLRSIENRGKRGKGYSVRNEDGRQ